MPPSPARSSPTEATPDARHTSPPDGSGRLVLALFFVWTFTALVYPLWDTDFWWHLKTGELILAEGMPPQVDRYTFPDYGATWIDLHWGFQVLVAWLHRLGGVNLVILVKAAVITAAVGVAWCAAGRSLPDWLKALLWFPAVVAISGRGYERPEMLSQLFLAVWLLIAFQVERQPRLIWLLPAVQLVWVNCHALFVLGLVVGACYVLDGVAREIAQGRWGLEAPSPRPSASTMIRAGGLLAAACLVNPYFHEGALFPLTLYRKFTIEQPIYSPYIGEFQQPIAFVRIYGLTNLYLIAELAVWALAGASFVWLAVRGRRWSVLRLTLFAAFSHLAWEAARNTNIFSLVSTVVLCANTADALALSPQAIAELSSRRWTLAVGACLSLLVALVVGGVWNQWGEKNKPFGLGEAKDWFIHDAAKFAGQPGFPDRAFVANNGQAAVYTYHNALERRVFMDGRLEVCSLQTFQAFNETLQRMAAGDPSWQAFIDPSGADLPVVILDARTNMSILALLGMLRTPGWRMVYADPTAGVFLDHSTAERLNLPRVDRQRLQLPEKLEAKLRELESAAPREGSSP